MDGTLLGKQQTFTWSPFCYIKVHLLCSGAMQTLGKPRTS